MNNEARRALIQATAAGTVLQLAMVVLGHFDARVAGLFAVLGVTISLLAGLLYGARVPHAPTGRAAGGGAIAGGVCALIGILVSFAMGDVPAGVLAFGTLSSAVTGAIGGLLGKGIGGRRTAPAEEAR